MNLREIMNNKISKTFDTMIEKMKQNPEIYSADLIAEAEKAKESVNPKIMCQVMKEYTKRMADAIAQKTKE